MSKLRVVDPGFGPWLYIYGGDGIIAEIVGRDEQAKALAQQFIAAPDLLAACEAILRWAGERQKTFPLSKILTEVKSAIAKAKGEA